MCSLVLDHVRCSNHGMWVGLSKGGISMWEWQRHRSGSGGIAMKEWEWLSHEGYNYRACWNGSTMEEVGVAQPLESQIYGILWKFFYFILFYFILFFFFKFQYHMFVFAPLWPLHCLCRKCLHGINFFSYVANHAK